MSTPDRAGDSGASTFRLAYVPGVTPGKWVRIWEERQPDVPLELVALGRGDQPAKVTPEQLARALRSDDGISGVIVNPAGPWIRLSRAQLAPVLAIGA